MMKHLQGLHVLVLGLGATGAAMVRWCAAHGATVTGWDSRSEMPVFAQLREELPAVMLSSESPSLQSVQLVLKTPGLPPHDVRIAALLHEAKATGVAVQAEWDLFARALADLREEQGYAPQIVAITGTNGKTTTTTMAAELIERVGRRVAMAGNVGPTMLDTLAQAIAQERAEWPEVWVLELSSFQLQDAQAFAADAAVVLNVTQDHLDWHGSMEAYAAAKARVYGGHGVMVVNRDDPAVMAMIPAPPPPTKGPRSKAPPPRAVVRFGLGAPEHPGDFGLIVENGMAWLVRALPSEEGKRKGEDEELHIQRLMPADALRIRGRHNAANALAALALATSIGCPLAPMLHGLREYRGQAHRVEWIGAVGDVDAFDDSKGTNVGATVAALDGLGADKTPAKLVLILGGDGKGQDFTPLRQPLQRHARAVALIGRDAERIEPVVTEAGIPHQRHATLPEAVAWCFAQAKAGDAVLLSPACASLDMFKGYAHRAEVFVDAVRALALERGEAVA